MEAWKIAELRATGIDVDGLFELRSQEWVEMQIRLYWPVPAGKPNARVLPRLNSIEYYENLAAVAMTGDLIFYDFFVGIPGGAKVSKEQLAEINEYLNNDAYRNARARGPMPAAWSQKA